MSFRGELQEHLKTPRTMALLGPGASRGEGANLACGDLLVIELQEHEGCVQIGYQVRGCAALVAVSSLCASLLEGTDWEHRAEFDVDAAVANAGGLDRRGAHAARVFGRALGAAVLACPG